MGRKIQVGICDWGADRPFPIRNTKQIADVNNRSKLIWIATFRYE